MRVALLEPEIPFNTGNIGRTCLGLGAKLHLVGPLGFSLEDRYLKRAGLDYWDEVAPSLHPDFDSLLRALPRGTPLLFFSAEARRDFWSAPYSEGCCLVFGKESVGLPRELRERYAESLYRIPHSGSIRSLNLSTAVGVALYEALRQTRISPRIPGLSA